MFRKQLIVDYGLLQKEYGFYADVDFWMELLHNHDAYHCADPLILCPQKSVQPQQFRNDIIKVNMDLVCMHLKHRKKAFRKVSLTFAKEMAIFYAFALYHTSYTLLLVTKNFSFKYFMESRKLLMRQSFLLTPWAILLALYPFSKMILWSYQVVKQKPSFEPEFIAADGNTVDTSLRGNVRPT